MSPDSLIKLLAAGTLITLAALTLPKLQGIKADQAAAATYEETVWNAALPTTPNQNPDIGK